MAVSECACRCVAHGESRRFLARLARVRDSDAGERLDVLVPFLFTRNSRQPHIQASKRPVTTPEEWSKRLADVSVSKESVAPASPLSPLSPTQARSPRLLLLALSLSSRPKGRRISNDDIFYRSGNLSYDSRLINACRTQRGRVKEDNKYSSTLIHRATTRVELAAAA